MKIKPSDLIEKFQKALKDKWGYIWGTAGEQWTEAKQNSLVKWFAAKYGSDWKNNEEAKKHDKYRGALNGSKWIGHTVADCSGLFSWAFKQLGGSIYHGSNTIWRDYCSDKGQLTKRGRTDGQPLKRGTAVFTGNDSGKPHIGLYVGNDLVIEASGTNAGVITTTISGGKWTYWGELKGVDYADTVNDGSDIKTNPTRPTLKKGNKGKWVTTLQELLLDKGYNLGSYGVDGDFGKATDAAVRAFQSDNDLKVDGIVGEKTWDALYTQTILKLFTVHIPKLMKSAADELLSKYPGSWMTNE